MNLATLVCCRILTVISAELVCYGGLGEMLYADDLVFGGIVEILVLVLVI